MNNEAKVTVLSAEVTERTGEFESGGETIKYTTRKQKGKMEVGGFAYPYDIRLEDGQAPYAVGNYTLNLGQCITVNKGVASLSKFSALLPAK